MDFDREERELRQEEEGGAQAAQEQEAVREDEAVRDVLYREYGQWGGDASSAAKLTWLERSFAAEVGRAVPCPAGEAARLAQLMDEEADLKGHLESLGPLPLSDQLCAKRNRLFAVEREAIGLAYACKDVIGKVNAHRREHRVEADLPTTNRLLRIETMKQERCNNLARAAAEERKATETSTREEKGDAHRNDCVVTTTIALPMAEQEPHLSPMGADAESGSSSDWGQPLQQDEYDPQQPLLQPSQPFAAPALPRMPPSFDAVSHFLNMGLSPNEIIQQGLLDVQTVVTTCQVMGVPMEGYAGASSSAGQQPYRYLGPPPTMGSAAGPPKAKRKRKRGPAKAAAAKGQVQAEGEATAEAGDATEAEMAELLRQKVELERQRAILLRAERKKSEENGAGAEIAAVDDAATPGDPTALSAPASDPEAAPADSMKAMRDAALASMKRKRISVEPSANKDVESQPTSSDTTAREAPSQPESSDPTAKEAPSTSTAPPRGPASSSNGYRDIDAPQSDLARREREAADALLNAYDAEDDFGSQRSMAGAATVRQARRPLSYMDDVFRFEANAPAGQVDYTAPLPSLVVASASRLGSMEATTAPTTPVLTAAGARRTRTPFLGTASADWQRVVVEYSDDEESSEEESGADGESDIRRVQRRARTEQMHFILQAWRKERGFTSAKERPRSPATPLGESAGRGSIEANALLLQSKEREIEMLKEQMRLLEQKRRLGKAATPAEQPSKGPSIPSYQSPFARFPSLQQVVDEQQQE